MRLLATERRPVEGIPIACAPGGKNVKFRSIEARAFLRMHARRQLRLPTRTLVQYGFSDVRNVSSFAQPHDLLAVRFLVVAASGPSSRMRSLGSEESYS